MGPACSKCGIDKPRTLEFFYRQAATSDGLTSWCRDCDRLASRERKRAKRATGWKAPRNPDKEKEYYIRYREKNRDRVLERQALQQKIRMQNPAYRACQAVGRRIRNSIKSGRNGSLRHLPYTTAELIKHIEKQFAAGMSWGNYGEYWHIDHILPVSSFVITSVDDTEFLACWALSNLRPLEAPKNLSKGATRTHLL